MALCNWSAADVRLAGKWIPDAEATTSSSSSSASFSLSRPVFCCLRPRQPTHRMQSSNPSWKSRRIFSFGGNDTVLNDLDFPDLKALLHSKKVIHKEVMEPDPHQASSSPEAMKGEQGRSKQQGRKVHNLVFVSAEVAPYSKVGGLSDVCGSLPVVLASRGHRVMVVSPRYLNASPDNTYSGAFDTQCRIRIGCFSGQHEVAFFHEFRDGVDWVFVDHSCYHRPGNPYGDGRGAYGDNQLFIHAVPLHATLLRCL